MTLPLTELGEEMLGWLPRHLQGSIDVQSIIDIEAREAERMETGRTELLDQFFVQTATWGLSIWEQALQLPVEPADEFAVALTHEERRQIVLAKLRSNIVQSAAQWTGVLIGYGLSYSLRVDHDGGVLHLDITDNPSEYSANQLEALIKSISPAHYDLIITYRGFILGESELGDEL